MSFIVSTADRRLSALDLSLRKKAMLALIVAAGATATVLPRWRRHGGGRAAGWWPGRTCAHRRRPWNAARCWLGAPAMAGRLVAAARADAQCGRDGCIRAHAHGG